jgi:hypothetical protein
LQYAATLRDKGSAAPSLWPWLRNVLVSGLTILLFLVLSGFMFVSASASAIPGDALYGPKRFIEDVRLNTSASPETAAALLAEFHQRRLVEIEALLLSGREEMVMFSGTVKAMAGDRWIVETIPVAIGGSTIIPDVVDTGNVVQVSGKTLGGALLADRIDLVSKGQPDPDLPLPTPSAVPSPTRPPATEPTATPEQTESEPEEIAPKPPPAVIEDDIEVGEDDGGAAEGGEQVVDEDGDGGAENVPEDGGGEETDGSEDDAADSSGDAGGDSDGGSDNKADEADEADEVDDADEVGDADEADEEEAGDEDEGEEASHESDEDGDESKKEDN